MIGNLYAGFFVGCGVSSFITYKVLKWYWGK